MSPLRLVMCRRLHQIFCGLDKDTHQMTKRCKYHPLKTCNNDGITFGKFLPSEASAILGCPKLEFRAPVGALWGWKVPTNFELGKIIVIYTELCLVKKICTFDHYLQFESSESHDLLNGICIEPFCRKMSSWHPQRLSSWQPRVTSCHCSVCTPFGSLPPMGDEHACLLITAILPRCYMCQECVSYLFFSYLRVLELSLTILGVKVGQTLFISFATLLVKTFHRENSPVTQTSPEPTLLSWGGGPQENFSPHPWPHGKPGLIALIGPLRPYCSQSPLILLRWATEIKFAQNLCWLGNWH